jgi:hypothetical protein
MNRLSQEGTVTLLPPVGGKESKASSETTCKAPSTGTLKSIYRAATTLQHEDCKAVKKQATHRDSKYREEDQPEMVTCHAGAAIRLELCAGNGQTELLWSVALSQNSLDEEVSP